MSKLFYVLLLLSIISCASKVSFVAETNVPKDHRINVLDSLVTSSEVFSNNFTGIMINHPETSKKVYALNEDKYFTPASNTKLFTFLAGLEILKDTLPALDYVIRGDSLIFWGTGNPFFLHPDYNDEKLYEFLRNSPYKLFYSDAHYSDEILGPGWSWGDLNSYYSAERTSLPIFGNIARATFLDIQQTKLKEKGKVYAISPPSMIQHIEHQEFKEGDRVLERPLGSTSYVYKPYADTTEYSIDKPFHYTPELFIELLSDTLKKKVTYIEQKKPQKTRRLYSGNKWELLKYMLQSSDNFLAEQILLMSSVELGLPLNTTETIQWMKKNSLNEMSGDPQWVDGSGLSRYNMFTPTMMIQLLQKIDSFFEDKEKLYDLLPAGGERGTIRRWYAHREGGSPYVFAKTGTLSNNHCLSGYLISKSGKRYYFSFMNNHYITSSSVPKVEMEKVLWYIYNNF